MSKELYVGHMSYQAVEEDILKLFSISGTVTSVHIITDPESGQSKGCGYVRMSTEAEAKDAIETLDGALLLDRVITVSEARPQKPKDERPSGKGRRPGQGKTFGKGRVKS